MKNRDIVITGLQPWDLPIAGNARNIAHEFAKDNRVLYVNSPVDRLTASRERANESMKMRRKMKQGKLPSIEKISDNLWVLYPPSTIESIGSIPLKFIFDWLNRVNNKRFASDIDRGINELGFNNIVLFCDNDIYRSFYLSDLLKPDKMVYYSRDNLTVVDYWVKHAPRLEPKMMSKADCVVCNSTYLTDVASRYNSKSHYVGQGCDFTLFNDKISYPRPKEYSDIPESPIIGYAGFLTSLRLDVELLEDLADAHPYWSFVLVGPEDPVFKKSSLHNKKNVFFLGLKRSDELPAYVAHFDVAMNPQRLNEVTIGNYPRKVDEYLAMGKPVVATRTPAMSIFAEYTFLGVGVEEYSHLITAALSCTDPEHKMRRVNIAMSHTWENSVANIYRAIESS